MNDQISTVYIEQRNNARDIREFCYKQIVSDIPFPEDRGMYTSFKYNTGFKIDPNIIRSRSRIVY